MKRNRWDDEEPDGAAEAPSKSRRKRESAALQSLGERLVELRPDQLTAIDIPDALRSAVESARAIHQRGARRRQLQYIGRLMREVDPAPIAEALAALEGKSAQSAARLHHLEQWRERLLTDEAALGELLAAHPDADRQQLRQLIRAARSEREAGKPPRSARALFRLLRSLEGEGEAEPD